MELVKPGPRPGRIVESVDQVHTLERLRRGCLSATSRLPCLKFQALLVARNWALYVLPAEKALLLVLQKISHGGLVQGRLLHTLADLVKHRTYFSQPLNCREHGECGQKASSVLAGHPPAPLWSSGA